MGGERGVKEELGGHKSFRHLLELLSPIKVVVVVVVVFVCLLRALIYAQLSVPLTLQPSR